MAEMQTLFSMIDALPSEDLEQLYHYIRQRHEHSAANTMPSFPSTFSHESAEEIREEVNAVINDALELVQRKRKTGQITRIIERIK